MFAATFDGARGDLEAILAIAVILHTVLIVAEVGERVLDGGVGDASRAGAAG